MLGRSPLTCVPLTLVGRNWNSSRASSSSFARPLVAALSPPTVAQSNVLLRRYFARRVQPTGCCYCCNLRELSGEQATAFSTSVRATAQWDTHNTDRERELTQIPSIASISIERASARMRSIIFELLRVVTANLLYVCRGLCGGPFLSLSLA